MNEKKRSGKIVLLLLLLFAVLLSSVTYAAASTYLEINGTARIENYNWSIHFDNLQDAKIDGEIIENKKPLFNQYKTIISGFDVTFKNPTDKVIYNFDIVNDGNIDAYISSILVNDPVCKSINMNKDNEKEFCNNLKYKLLYEDGTIVNINDSLEKETTKKVQLVIEYDGEEFPNDEIEMNDISVTIGYSQK